MERMFDSEAVTSSERYLYTPSSFARKHLCYVQEAGTLKCLKPHTSARDGLDSFLFIVVNYGRGKIVYGDEELEMKKGDAVLLDCRTSYRHTSSEDDPWELAWTHFDGAKAEALYPLFLKANEGSPRLHLGRDEREATHLVRELMDAKGENSMEAEIRSDAVIGNILLFVMEHAGAENAAADLEGIRELINRRLEAGDGRDALMKVLREEYGCDDAALDAGFSGRYGIGLDAYVTNRMLNKAKELLRFTILQMDEVIAQSGLGTEEDFRRIFNEKEQMSPEDYRKKWAQWIKG